MPTWKESDTPSSRLPYALRCGDVRRLVFSVRAFRRDSFDCAATHTYCVMTVRPALRLGPIEESGDGRGLFPRIAQAREVELRGKWPIRLSQPFVLIRPAHCVGPGHLDGVARLTFGEHRRDEFTGQAEVVARATPPP